MIGALVLTVMLVAFLVYIGMPWLAVVVGLAGALVIAGAPRKEPAKARSFGDVPVPEPGGYPGWEFWKELLEKTGENIWELVRTFTGVHWGIDAWSEGMREKVWQQDKPPQEYLPYGVYAVHKKFAPEMVRVDYMANILRMLEQRRKVLEAQVPHTPPGPTRDALLREIKDLKDKEKEILDKMQELLKKGLD